MAFVRVEHWQEHWWHSFQRPYPSPLCSSLPVSLLPPFVFVSLAPPSAEAEQVSRSEVLLHSLLKAPCSSSMVILLLYLSLHHVYLATSITRGWPSHWSFENAPGTNGRAVAMVQCIVAGWNFAARHVSVGVCLPPRAAAVISAVWLVWLNVT